MLMGYRYLFGSFLAPGLPSHMVPVNTLGGQPRTLDSSFHDVITPNADTPYSMAGLDLWAELGGQCKRSRQKPHLRSE